MPIDDKERCPAFEIEFKKSMRIRVIQASELLDLIDAWWIGLEDDIHGTIWDELDRAANEFFIEISTSFLRGELGNTMEVLFEAFLARLDQLKVQAKLCDRKEDLGELIEDNVLSHGTGARQYKRVYSRN